MKYIKVKCSNCNYQATQFGFKWANISINIGTNKDGTIRKVEKQGYVCPWCDCRGMAAK